MAEAVEHSFAHLNQDDLRAIVTYVRDVKPISSGNARQPRFGFGKPATYEASLRGTTGLTDSSIAKDGAGLQRQLRELP